ncbi:MAG TPA: restriction endonuclease subunit S [Agitococcus sp.]|nr:restriction endonuclease subunit S [Agitococcus sp.]
MSNVPVGYKQTDVGVIPEDWEFFLLGNIAIFSQGTQVGLEKQIKVEKEGYIKFLRIENYTQQSGDFRFVPQDEGKNKIVHEDDIVVVRYGATAGFIGIGLKGILANNLFKIEPNKKYLVKEFLFVFLKSDGVFKYFQDAMSGGAMPALSFKTVKKLSIILPTLTEQTAIATALSDVDALLNQLDKLIAKKRDIKQATMQQLLTGKKRLAGFSGEWEVKKLGEVASLSRLNIIPANWPTQMYVHFSLPAFDEGKSPVVELGSEIKSNKFIVPEGTVLVSKLNPRIPRVWMPDEIPENSIASTEFLVLFPKNGISRQFLFILCKSPKFCEQMEKSATGTTGSHQRISPSDALTMSIFVPSDSEEQTAIATLLTDMDNEISQLQQRRHKTHALKQGMMQQLLTGKIRLI